MGITAYFRFTKGDLNAFFALFFDNLINFVVLAGILKGLFGFPIEFILKYMVPGTALGVMFGDIIYSVMAVRLSRLTGKRVTAIPLGLDTPSTIGIAVAVLGPAYLGYKGVLGSSGYAAEFMTWKLGMAVMLWMGIVKIIAAFLGQFIARVIPVAGLLGSLAGVGIAWLGAEQFMHSFSSAVAGLASLVLVLYTLVARYQLPGKLPGAAVAVILATFIFYLGAFLGIPDARLPELQFMPGLTPPAMSLGGFSLLFTDSVKYLPVAIPFGLMTIIGGINVTEGARLAGDNFKMRNVLLTEAFATVVAGIAGGVSQSTPYIGHSAYKKMGAASGYTMYTGILTGAGASLGLISFIVNLIPHSVISPILIFIGFEITALAYQQSPASHSIAVSFAIIPSLLNYAYIKVKLLYEPVVFGLGNLKNKVAPEIVPMLSSIIPPNIIHDYPYLQAMGQGFIVTAILWGASVAYIIDGKLRAAAALFLTAGVLTSFGIMHSATSTGEMYFPGNIPVVAGNIPYLLSMGYFTASILVFLFSFFQQSKTDEDHI